MTWFRPAPPASIAALLALIGACSDATAPTAIDVRVAGACGCTVSSYRLLLLEPRTPRPCLRHQSDASPGELTLPAAVVPGDDLELVLLGRCDPGVCVRCEARRRFRATAGTTIELTLAPTDGCLPGDPGLLALRSCDAAPADGGAADGDAGADATVEAGAVDGPAPDGPTGRRQVFTSDGLFTVPEGVTRITVAAWGGGGGATAGTSGGARGGGGGYAETTVTVAPGDAFGIKVGQGGEGGAPCSGRGGMGYLPGGNGGPLNSVEMDGFPGAGPSESGGSGGAGTGGGGDGGDGGYGGGGGGGSPDYRQRAAGGGGSTAVLDGASQVVAIAGGGGGGGMGLFGAGGHGGAGCALAGAPAPSGGGGGGGGGGCVGDTTQDGSGRQPGNAAAAEDAGLGGEPGTPRTTSCPQMRGANGRVVISY